jgi:hypothetical protein
MPNPRFAERWAVWARGDEFGGSLEWLQLICGFDSEFAIHRRLFRLYLNSGGL